MGSASPSWNYVGHLTERGRSAAFSIGNVPRPPTEYKRIVSTGAIRQYWNCLRPAPDHMRLEGLIANQWSDQPVGFLEWELVEVNADGRGLSSVGVASKAIKLMRNQYPQYRGDLRMTGGKARSDLYHRYQPFDRS